MKRKSLKGSKAVVMVGMHRSGTSAVAGALRFLGVDLGSADRLMPADGFNSEGYWEHSDIVRLHDQALNLCQTSWATGRPLPDRFEDLEEFKEIRESLAAILRAEFTASETWGFKDPRASLLIPLWRDILEAAGVSPRYLICIRNPVDVATSLARRDDFGQTESYGIWLNYTLSALRETAGSSRVLVEYDDFVENPESALEMVAERLELSLPQDRSELRDRLAAAVKPSMRHSRSPQDAIDDGTGAAEMVRDAYRLCRDVVRDQSELDRPEFDKKVEALYRRFAGLASMVRTAPHLPYYVRVYWRGADGLYDRDLRAETLTSASPAFGRVRIDLTSPLPAELRIELAPDPGRADIRSIRILAIDGNGAEAEVIASYSEESNFLGLQPDWQNEAVYRGGYMSLLSLGEATPAVYVTVPEGVVSRSAIVLVESRYDTSALGSVETGRIYGSALGERVEELHEIRKELEDHKTRVTEQALAIKSLIERVRELEEERAAYFEARAHAEYRCHTLERALDEIQASTVWRLSRPYVKIAEKLSRKKSGG